MKPDKRFLNQRKHFWANVRTISQQVGYTARTTGQIKVPTLQEMKEALERIGLSSIHILNRSNRPTKFGKTLLAYFEYRADVLNRYVESRLMEAEQARRLFEKLSADLCPQCPIPMNKQKGEKKAPAYFTAIINMLIEANAEGFPCDYDPRELTTVTRDGAPLRTLARRVDGAFLSTVNPIAVWEIKEYYYTTSFGSRVADGVYESLLDGMELEELREHEKIDVRHYLMVDAHYTWWDCGRSYLCRIIDMLHMGYVDEVLFGYEVVERLPSIVKEWVSTARGRNG
ncbi:MAG: hypothetical protein HY231_22745 [Acidobacteria bacterium]|nr:hypothetical protein [Acidobacteriota bacterium]